jgi:hypothetical protein
MAKARKARKTAKSAKMGAGLRKVTGEALGAAAIAATQVVMSHALGALGNKKRSPGLSSTGASEKKQSKPKMNAKRDRKSSSKN